MKSKAEVIAQLDREADELQDQATQLLAKASAKRYEADLLRGLGSDGGFTELTHSDAVHRVLSTAGREMSPTEIHNALVEEGRSDSYASLGGILQSLKRQGRISNPGRGRWVSLG